MAANEAAGAGRLGALIIKVASRCNLNCSYCYLYNHEDTTFHNQPRFMDAAVFRAALERARQFVGEGGDRPISIILHGGEPTLVGPGRLREYCRIAKEALGPQLGSIAIQTNATLLSEPILDILLEHGVWIGVSMDGPAAVHNEQRLFRNGGSSYERTLAGVRALQQRGLEVRVLCVVQPGADGGEIYDHFRSLGVAHFDFLLPDVSHDNKERLYGRFGPAPVGRYLVAAFDRWIEEDDPGVSIRLFRGMVRSLLGAEPESDTFGNPLMSYAVIGTNGDIEALDALKVCSNGIAATGLNVTRNGFGEIEASGSLLAKAMFEGLAPTAACRSCAEFDHCGGGYLPHRYSRARGFDNPSVWCEDIRLLFGHLRNSVERHA